jgi:hypothetical protein
MSTPRIDSTRNAIDALILRLAEFRAEVHDIHDLATNRPRAAEQAKVNGGSRDYALDTHGDIEARDLYIAAVREVVHADAAVSDAIGRIRSHLTAGGGSSGFDRSAVVPKHEVASAIAAAQRRRQRGEYEPHLIARQPPVGYVEPTVELDNLRNAVLKMAAGTKPDRSRLTPAEQDAWRRAATPDAKSA